MPTRRELFERMHLGLTFLPALAFAPRMLLNNLLFEPEGELVPVKPLLADPYREDGKSVVVMVHGRDTARMLETGIEALGGLAPLRLAGKRVLIKPNVVNDRPAPSTTGAVLVEAVVRRLRAAGAAAVTVADSSGMLRFPTRENLTATGIQRAAESAGAQVLALEEEPWVRVEPPAATIMRRFYVSKAVYHADVVINLPVVKTHRFAHYSCSLKNLVGIVHPRYRPSLRFLSGDWHESIAELNLAVHPVLTIADARTMMIAGGPTSGTPAAADVILLSADRVALDAVALALIRTYGQWPKVAGGSIWSQRQLRRAAELGLGARGPVDVRLVTRALRPAAEFDRLESLVRRDLYG